MSSQLFVTAVSITAVAYATLRREWGLAPLGIPIIHTIKLIQQIDKSERKMPAFAGIIISNEQKYTAREP
jgi:hypothetical protein